MSKLSVCSTKNASLRGASRQSTQSTQPETAEPIKLYSSAAHPGHWIAYAPDAGWVIFPARENGWEERRAARGLDPVHLRQVSLRMAVATGLIEALRSTNDGKAA